MRAKVFIGLDGRPFGIDMTEIRGVDDPWDYIAEAYRLASQKSDSYARRGIFRFPIALVMHSTEPLLFDIRDSLKATTWQDDFEALGFSEVWAVDFDAYYSPGHPLRLADMFCFLAFTGLVTIGSLTDEPARPITAPALVAAADVGVSHGYQTGGSDLIEEIKAGKKTLPQAKRELKERKREKKRVPAPRISTS